MTDSARDPALERSCDQARLRVSLALDGALDDVGRTQLERHLRACAACAKLAGEMRQATDAIRSAPLVRHRCDLATTRLVRDCSSGLGRLWAGAGVAVAALVLATGALPQRDDAAAAHSPRAAAAVVVAPLELPIGQRSAMDDFVAPAGTS